MGRQGYWNEGGLTAAREQLSPGPWRKKEDLTLVYSFFKSSGSRVVFFRRGLTIADLKEEGKEPVEREWLMMLVM